MRPSHGCMRAIGGPSNRMKKKSKFTSGTSLSIKWAKEFILGYILQNFEGCIVDKNEVATSKELLKIQKSLSDNWRMAVEPLETSDSKEILRALTRYSVGDGSIPTDTLQLMNKSLISLKLGDFTDPHNMLQLLERVSFIRHGDNPHRLGSRVVLSHDPAVASIATEHLTPNDPYDKLRGETTENIYAIDSISTSEVDDAIGLTIDSNGVERFTVYVSDATVHCPFGSKLEVLTARTMCSTSYLPEGVYFMLPTNIVEAATLRPDRKCRTFNINFSIDPKSGQLHDLSISLGWAHQLRRITYDAVQELYETCSNTPLSQTPPWCNANDIKKLHRIHYYAKIRQEVRRKRMMEKYKQAMECNLPEPLIKVIDCKVASVEDQVVGTKDARLAVAELMIAANETCSRLAQQYKIDIPFRGTRPVSTDHEVANEPLTSPGTRELSPLNRNLDSQGELGFFAKKVFDSISSLAGVTRAIYHHEPIHHLGLDTYHYCHSTSPLRRYPDMLVHHQHKVHLAKSNGYLFEDLIPSFQMADLCADASTKQEQGALLQDKSQIYWLHRHILDFVIPKGMLLDALVGSTRYVGAAVDEERFLSYRGPAKGSKYISDLFIPSLQMTHFMFHNNDTIRVGTTVSCRVEKCDPLTGYVVFLPVKIFNNEEVALKMLSQALVPKTISHR